MNEDINLAVKSKVERKTKEMVFAASLGFFLLTFVIGAVMLLYSLSLASTSATLEVKREGLRGKIAALSSEKGKFLTLYERLNSIRRIISGRKKIDDNVDKVLSLLPEDLAVESVTADNKGVSVGLTSPNLTDFDTLLEDALPAIGKEKTLGLKNINVGSFSQRGSGYSISIDFNFRTDTK